MQRSLIFITLLFCLSLAQRDLDFVNTREFQFQLEDDVFTSGRDDGIAAYIQAFEAASGLNVDTFNRYVSIRTEASVNLNSPCNAEAVLRQRVYTSGDLLGLVTIDIKSSQALTEKEANNEPFTIAEQYADQSIQNVEYDIHPCEADYAADGRIFTNQAVSFSSCGDVREFYPDFSNSDGQFSLELQNGVVYVVSYNTTVWGGSLSLDFTLNYDSESDAIADINYSGGEFSYTITASSGAEFTSAQTQHGKEIYKAMLADIGDTEYPCSPAVDIDDFFPSDSNSNNSNSNNSNSNNSNSNNDSSSSGVLVVSAFVFVATLCL